MKAIRLHIHGKLFADNGRSALLLLQPSPQTETAESLYLRFPFITAGTEEPVFPGFILDDWGTEIKGMELYNWFAESAAHFPRAELFGFELNGTQTQLFLRELEIYASYPCYVYSSKEQPLSDGILLEIIWLPDSAVVTPEITKRPLELKRPLPSARVTWWRVPQNQPILPQTML